MTADPLKVLAEAFRRVVRARLNERERGIPEVRALALAVSPDVRQAFLDAVDGGELDFSGDAGVIAYDQIKDVQETWIAEGRQDGYGRCAA